MAVDLTVDRLLEMRGKPVYDQSGDKIGSIEDIYIDDETREPEWLGLGMGFLGMKHAIVPLANADFRDEGLEVPYTKDQVKDAPNIGEDDDITPTQEMELSRHYGLHAEAFSPPSVSRADTTDPAGASVPPSIGGTERPPAGPGTPAGGSPTPGTPASSAGRGERDVRGERGHLHRYRSGRR
jgi:sporulation protein YlmC with PRC-barrel domain